MTIYIHVAERHHREKRRTNDTKTRDARYVVNYLTDPDSTRVMTKGFKSRIDAVEFYEKCRRSNWSAEVLDNGQLLYHTGTGQFDSARTKDAGPPSRASVAKDPNAKYIVTSEDIDEALITANGSPAKLKLIAQRLRWNPNTTRIALERQRQKSQDKRTRDCACQQTKDAPDVQEVANRYWAAVVAAKKRLSKETSAEARENYNKARNSYEHFLIEAKRNGKEVIRMYDSADAVTRGGMPIRRDDLAREPLKQQLREKPAPRTNDKRTRDAKVVYRAHGFTIEDDGDTFVLKQPASFGGSSKKYKKGEVGNDLDTLKEIIEEIWQER